MDLVVHELEEEEEIIILPLILLAWRGGEQVGMCIYLVRECGSRP